LVHNANVIEGSGFFIAVLEAGTYAAMSPADEVDRRPVTNR
jgi:hypothetical protein